MDDLISRQAAIDVLKEAYWDKDIQSARNDPCIVDAMTDWSIRQIKDLPSAEPEWNNHTVACLLAEMFGDDCACNFNGIDEWLPEKCEMIDSCPHPVGVACWEQFLMHRSERRTDE